MNPFRIIVLITAALLAQPAAADLYKCSKNGKTTYQASPCGDDVNVGKLDIKESTEEEKAAAQAKLQAIRSQYEADKAQKEQKEQKAKEQEAQARKSAAVIVAPGKAPGR